MLADRALPPAFANSDLFERVGGDALKLYLWLRARSRLNLSPEGSHQGAYIEAEATAAEIERAVGVSKNTVTKLARDLQALGFVSFEGGRTGYRFRLGERLVRPATAADLPLAADVYYLDARLADSSGREARDG